MTRSPLVRSLLAAASVASTTAVARHTRADAPSAPADTAPDVAIRDPSPPRRMVSIEWNPLALLVNRISLSAIIVPVDHHALVLNPFYASTTTYSIALFDDESLQTGQPSAKLPAQTFQGFGGEIGYRYYTGEGGPRGLFVGPSLILAGMTANAQNGSQTSYFDFGIAADIGYELLVVDSVALAVGAGLQYSAPSKSLPNQQFPADVYANSRVLPRALASIGWAF